MKIYTFEVSIRSDDWDGFKNTVKRLLESMQNDSISPPENVINYSLFEKYKSKYWQKENDYE